MLFSNPVSITAGATYVASYFDPNGHYSYSAAAFGSAIDNPPLHGIANGSTGNGVFNYSATSSFPTSTYNANNYWVDVLFQPTPPGQVDRRDGDRGTSVRNGQLDCTERRWRDELQGHAVHRQHAADADDDDRQPAGNERDHQRAAAGNRLHVHRPGVQQPWDQAPSRRRRMR